MMRADSARVAPRASLRPPYRALAASHISERRQLSSRRRSQNDACAGATAKFVHVTHVEGPRRAYTLQGGIYRGLGKKGQGPPVAERTWRGPAVQVSARRTVT